MTYSKDWTLSKNKSFEIQIDSKEPEMQWLIFDLRFTTKCDHAGFSFRFEFLRIFGLDVTFYDHRHWSYDHDTWEIYSDELDLNKNSHLQS